MARIGSNPLRIARAEKLHHVVLCVVTHLPTFDGYHKDRLEVVQTCLTSMTQHAGIEHSIAIWDNGSAPKVRKWIKDKIKPDIFVESINVGKTAGRTALIRMLPPGTVVCYSDDDMYFYPGWLAPQLEILKTFPNVACVSGYPVRTSFRWGNDNTKQWAGRTAKVDIGRFIPDEWEDDFAVSIGRDPMQHRITSANDAEWLITWQERQAYATSHHCQFIGYQERLERATRFDGLAMGDEKVWDIELDKIGLRLATVNRLARHIGNVIHDQLREEIEAIK